MIKANVLDAMGCSLATDRTGDAAVVAAAAKSVFPTSLTHEDATVRISTSPGEALTLVLSKSRRRSCDESCTLRRALICRLAGRQAMNTCEQPWMRQQT